MITQLTAALLLAQTPTQTAPTSGPPKTKATTAPPFSLTPGRVLQGLRALAYAPAPRGSRFAATMEDGKVRIIDAETNQTLKVLEGHPQPAYAIAWSPDGTMLATGDESARIFLWETKLWTKVREMRTHTRGIQNLSFNAAKTYLISTGKDDAIKVYGPSTGKEIRTILGQGSNFYGANFISTSNDFGVGILSYGARLYNATTGSIHKLFTGHAGLGVLDVDFNPSGTLAATAGRDATGAVWDMKTGKRLNSLKGHTDWLVHVRFSPNGKYVATSSSDRTVRVYNTATYQTVATLENQSGVGSPLCFTADGKSLITVNFDDYIQVNKLEPALIGTPGKATPVKKAPAKKKKKGKRVAELEEEVPTIVASNEEPKLLVFGG